MFTMKGFEEAQALNGIARAARSFDLLLKPVEDVEQQRVLRQKDVFLLP